MTKASMQQEGQVAAADSAADEPVEESQEILVTGSRLQRQVQTDSPVPVVGVSEQDIQASGSTELSEILLDYPAVTTDSNSVNTVNNINAAGLSTISLRDLGELSGVETITLLVSEIPFHTHALMAADADPAESNVCTNNAIARSKNGSAFTTTATITQMAPQALAPAGGGLPHNNMQPYLTLNFCIALQGIFPQRP